MSKIKREENYSDGEECFELVLEFKFSGRIQLVSAAVGVFRAKASSARSFCKFSAALRSVEDWEYNKPVPIGN